MEYIRITHDTIGSEHICCAIADKKCTRGYELKKDWLKAEFDRGYVFRRLDVRGKIFIEYGPAEHAWVPVIAPNHFVMGCFWVSGQFKEQGHGKALLAGMVEDARAQGRDGIVAVAGTKKYHFMSDGKWLMGQGFVPCDTTASGFNLLVLPLGNKGITPRFTDLARTGECPHKDGYVAYYSNRCPYTDLHVSESLRESTQKRNLPLTIIKLESREQAFECPSPGTVFSLFRDGKFVSTDLSICLDSRFDKSLSGST